MASSRRAGVPQHPNHAELDRIDSRERPFQYARNASLPRTTGDPVTASAVGLAKTMSSRKCASTASASRLFQASAHSWQTSQRRSASRSRLSRSRMKRNSGSPQDTPTRQVAAIGAHSAFIAHAATFPDNEYDQNDRRNENIETEERADTGGEQLENEAFRVRPMFGDPGNKLTVGNQRACNRADQIEPPQGLAGSIHAPIFSSR